MYLEKARKFLGFITSSRRLFERSSIYRDWIHSESIRTVLCQADPPEINRHLLPRAEFQKWAIKLSRTITIKPERTNSLGIDLKRLKEFGRKRSLISVGNWSLIRGKGLAVDLPRKALKIKPKSQSPRTKTNGSRAATRSKYKSYD